MENGKSLKRGEGGGGGGGGGGGAGVSGGPGKASGGDQGQCPRAEAKGSQAPPHAPSPSPRAERISSFMLKTHE